MSNDAELITALERAKAQLLRRRQSAGEIEGNAIKHNIQAANLILGYWDKHKSIINVQRELATTIISRANQKERIKL